MKKYWIYSKKIKIECENIKINWKRLKMRMKMTKIRRDMTKSKKMIKVKQKTTPNPRYNRKKTKTNTARKWSIEQCRNWIKRKATLNVLTFLLLTFLGSFFPCWYLVLLFLLTVLNSHKIGFWMEVIDGPKIECTRFLQGKRIPD
jgi:K+-sensing histidine kinase KdpD